MVHLSGAIVLLIVFCAILAGGVTASSNSSACNAGGITQICDLCKTKHHHNTDTVAFLGHYSKLFKEKTKQAIQIARSYPGVVTDDQLYLHCTLQYLCCYTDKQYELIAKVLRKVPFFGLNITFDRVVCTPGYANTAYNDVQLRLSEDSESKLGAWVSKAEDAILDAGLPLKRRRSDMIPFHVSLLVVAPDKFPTENAVAAMNNVSFTGIEIEATSYTMLIPYHKFHKN